jgi:hypothetical protein
MGQAERLGEQAGLAVHRGRRVVLRELGLDVAIDPGRRELPRPDVAEPRADRGGGAET